MPTHTISAREPRGDRTESAVDRSLEAIGAHLEDAAHFPGGRADGIAHPRTEAEVAALVASAERVVPIGAQSSVTGGATPDGGLILSTDRLTSIQESGQDHVRVGAGVPLETLQNLLTSRGRWYAPVPTYTGAFVGGVVATNAAGAATFKYGTTRAWVDGLTVVLACGCVLDVVRGDVRAGLREGFAIACAHGQKHVRPGRYLMPDVAKCSAGYFAAPGMDLIDLFIGSEGTLGVIVDATLRVLPVPPAVALAMVPVRSESGALAIVDELRRASRRTWSERDPTGIDIAAIEYLDARCLEMLREDGVDRRHAIRVPDGTSVMLLVQIELPADTTTAGAFDDIAGATDADAPARPLARFCRVLDRHGVFDATEMALPGDERRTRQFLAFREGAPLGVNRRVGDAKRDIDARIDKTAADMIVPFELFTEMMAVYRDGYARRHLDYAIWGHISDGNVHPNVIPHSYEDVVSGREAILEFGREVARLGGCPLAEHGVGRSSVKQALLRQLYGDEALDDMRAIKRALDPAWKLAPGVILAERQA
jgi:D-lactate dehydrogenase (cytochrome)